MSENVVIALIVVGGSLLSAAVAAGAALGAQFLAGRSARDVTVAAGELGERLASLEAFRVERRRRLEKVSDLLDRISSAIAEVGHANASKASKASKASAASEASDPSAYQTLLLGVSPDMIRGIVEVPNVIFGDWSALGRAILALPAEAGASEGEEFANAIVEVIDRLEDMRLAVEKYVVEGPQAF